MLDSHQSGHATATKAQVAAALDALILKNASLGAWTEAADLDMPPGWDRTPGETAIFWSTRRWRLVTWGIVEIPTPAWHRGTSRRTSCEVSWAELEQVNNTTKVLRVAGHHPAHLFVPSQRRANDAVLAHLGQEIANLAADADADVVTYSADWNLDMRLERNRAKAGRVMARSMLPLKLLVPPGPTLRKRTIDAALTTGNTIGPWMLEPQPGLDHRGFGFASHAR